MKFPKLFLSLILGASFLCGCAKESAPSVEETLPPIPETIVVTEVPTEIPTEGPTAPTHSELYIPGLAVEDVLMYFNEVCLGAEFINSGNPQLLQRWEEPIYYTIEGDPTPEDISQIEAFAQWLNTIEGFPGMAVSPEPWQTNLNIYFCDQEELIRRMGDNFWGTDGAVTFWYQNDQIFDAIICIRTDLNQTVRNSVILEEIYNGLGPIQDTALRPDSIIWCDYSEPQALTPVDELLLRLLYHPDLACGMDAPACEEAIAMLYY